MSPERPIRVLLVAPGPRARRNLRAGLEARQEVDVAGEAGDLRTALLAAARMAPDAVVVATPAGDTDGGWALPAILRSGPAVPVLLTPLESWVGEGGGEAEAGRLVEVLRLAWNAGEELDDEGIALVAHDILAPAGSVVAVAEVLLRYWDRFAEPERRKAVARIAGLGRELGSLVERLVRSGDPSSFVGERRPAEIGPMLDEAVELIRPQAPGHRFEVSLQPGLPHARVDRGAIVEALANYLSNAAKYSPRGSLVRLTAGAVDGEVHVAVSDQGPGVDPRHRSLLFRKFSRLPNNGQPGHGLGLYLTRSIVEAHGGRVFVESRPGEGATFGMVLPASAASRPRRGRIPHRGAGLAAR